jgi:uncharacterized membrane protein YfcA
MEYLLYLVGGAIAGLLSGLFGVGGGLIIVPILAVIFSSLQFHEAHVMHMALATSMATIIFTSIASTRAHHRKQHVDWTVARTMTPGVVIGTLFGSLLATHIHSTSLQGIFALFVLLVATQLALDLKPSPHRQLPGKAGTGLIGGGIGVISSLVGIGGGTLSVPFLAYCNVAIHRAIGTSAAIGLPIAVSGALGYLIMGWGNTALPPHSLGFIYLPAFAGVALASSFTAPLGATLAQRFSAKRLKRLFAILLYAVGVKMCWGLF